MAYVCKHVLERERQVQLALHHSDGMWQLTCGGFDHSPAVAELYPVHLDHLLEMQPELRNALKDLPSGFLTEKTDDGWCQAAHDD